jgi:hypothetical protein
MLSTTTILQILLGLGTGVIFLLVARLLAPERTRAFLSIGLAGAAAIYVGFAVWGKAPPVWLGTEVAGLALYSALAWGRVYGAPRLLALGWLAHPLWDIGLHWSGVGAEYAPHWYVVACPSFDILVAIYLMIGL